MKRFILLLSLLVFAFAPKDSPNLLLITIDTLRADYLSCNGSKKVSTPNIDLVAKSGANFTKVRSPVPLTLPSHASILTGQYPYNHGVRDNGVFHLAADKQTIAEVLKGRGYHTAAFVGSFVLDHRFGLAQGFDHYDDRTWTNASMLENQQAERDAGAVGDAFAKWLKSARTPFFAWVHFYDPHAPYDPPAEFLRRYPKDPYAAEVAYTDAIIGRVVQQVRARSTSTIVALAADHGEGLGEHREQTHSLLIYNSTIHVPMILSAPGLIPPETKITSLVRLIDLAPTMLDYLGVDFRHGDGISLRSIIEKKSQPSITAYSESFYPRFNLGWSELRAIEAGKYKYIHAPKAELYDLETDPGELKNQILRSAAVTERMRNELLKISSGSSSVPKAIDSETEEKLRSLGYLSGGTGGTVSGDDPKDKIEVWNDIQRIIAMIERDRCNEAIPILERLLNKEQRLLLVYDYAASCAIRLEQWEKAGRFLQQALKNGLDASPIRLNLALVYLQQSRFADAEKELQKAISLNSTNVSAHYHLATIYRRMKRWDGAIEHYEQALKVNPDYVFALNGLGMTYASLGREEDAVKAFERAVEIDRSNAGAYFNLAVQLERMGRHSDAMTTYKKFLAAPQSKELQDQRQKAEEALKRLDGKH